MKSKLVIVLLAAVALTGCGKHEEKSPVQSFNTAVVLKVSVLQSGKLLADGADIALADLDTRLGQTKSQNGVVWYYREGGQGEPPAAAMEVMKLIVKHQLPISMSSKADFSDTIDQDGVSRPRR
jgi:hypothetical protein